MDTTNLFRQYKVNNKILALSYNEIVVLAILSSYENLNKLVELIDFEDFFVQNTDFLANKYFYIKRIKSKCETIASLRKNPNDQFITYRLSSRVKKVIRILSLENLFDVDNKLISLLNKVGVFCDSKQDYTDYLNHNMDIMFSLSDHLKYLKLFLMAHDDEDFSNNIDINSIVKVLDDLKAIDIKAFDYENSNPFFDYAVIATTNDKQAGAIISRLKKMGLVFRNINQTNEWTLIDLYDVIIHLFSKEGRTFYNFDDRLMFIKRVN